jgi:hypothetical protein
MMDMAPSSLTSASARLSAIAVVVMHELWIPGAGRSDDQDKSEVRSEEEGARYLASKISQDSGLLNK